MVHPARTFRTLLLLASSGLLAPACDTAAVVSDEATGTVVEAIDTTSKQYLALYLKNWPSYSNPPGQTQWTDVVIDNPNPWPARVTLTVNAEDGGKVLGTIVRIIPSLGRFDSNCDPAWESVSNSDAPNKRSLGWVELSSDRPVVATARTTVRDGFTCNAKSVTYNEEPLLRAPATRLFASHYLKSWPLDNTGRTQFTNPVVVNPGIDPANVTLVVHRRDGAIYNVSTTVAGRASWRASSSDAWLNLPDLNNDGSIGWVEAFSDRPIVAENRLTVHEGETSTGPMVMLDGVGFTATTAARLRASTFAKGSPSTGTSGPLTQWSDLTLVNPNAATATFRVDVFREGGTLAGSFIEALPAGRSWTTPDDYDWGYINATGGWVEVDSDLPLFGSNRVALRKGPSRASDVFAFDDEPLAQTLAKTSYASSYLRNVPSGGGLTAWTHLVVTNPSSDYVDFTVWVLRGDGLGSLVPAFTRTLPPKGVWNSFSEMSTWMPITTEAHGWTWITASAPVIALGRSTLRQGNSPTSPVALFDDLSLDQTPAMAPPAYWAPPSEWPEGGPVRCMGDGPREGNESEIDETSCKAP